MSLPAGPPPGCDGCAGAAAAGEPFCPDCGRRLLAPGGPSPAAGRAISVFGCPDCGATMSFGAAVGALTCPFCGALDLAGTPRTVVQPEPEATVPFRLDPGAAIGAFRAALGSLWLRPGGLAGAALVDAVHPCWISAWAVRARLATCWTADRPRGGAGDAARWVPAAGTLAEAELSAMVPASAALDPGELEGILPFTLEGPGGRPEPDAEGIPVEPFGVSRRQARAEALRLLAARRAGEAAGAAGPGARNLRTRTRAESMHLRPVLVPVFLITYVHGGLLFRYVVNAQTGRAHGTAPWSGPKIAALVLAVVLVGLALLRGT